MRTSLLAVTVLLAVLSAVSCVTESPPGAGVTPESHETPAPPAAPVVAGAGAAGLWKTNGPYGGQVNSIVVNPETPTTLYASIPSVGVFRSLNAGERWELVFAGGCCGDCAVAVDPLAPDRVYASRPGEGLFRSDDGGAFWKAIPIPVTRAETSRAFPHPALAGVVFAGLSGPAPEGCGLYRSEDYGESWVGSGGGLTDPQVTALAFDPTDARRVYVGTGNGNVFRSTDGGESWERIGQPDQYIGPLAVNPFGAHEVWASGASGNHWGYLWKYESGGWVPVSLGRDVRPLVTAILFSGSGEGTIWLGGGGLKSVDGGLSWARFVALDSSIFSLAVDPTDSRVVYQGYIGAGVYKTTDDGASWREVNQGLAGLIPSGLTVAPHDPKTVYAIVPGLGVYRTLDGGATWNPIPGASTLAVSLVVDAARPGRLYVGATNGVEICDNGGSSWHRVYPKPPPEYAASCGFGLLAMASTGQPGRMVIGGVFRPNDATLNEEVVAGAIYFSTDFGESWAYVDLGPDLSPVVRLATDPNDPMTVYAGTGWEGAGGGIWKSSNGGASWSPTQFSAPGVDGLAVDPRDSSRVYATCQAKLFVSRDGGQSWEVVSDQAGEALLAVGTAPSTLYTSGWGGGLRASTDGGQHWSQVAESLADTRVWSMAAADTEAGLTLYVGAVGGVYRLGSAPEP